MEKMVRIFIEAFFKRLEAYLARQCVNRWPIGLYTYPTRSTVALVPNFFQCGAVGPFSTRVKAVRDSYTSEIMTQFLQLPVVGIWNYTTETLHIVDGHSFKCWSSLTNRKLKLRTTTYRIKQLIHKLFIMELTYLYRSCCTAMHVLS